MRGRRVDTDDFYVGGGGGGGGDVDVDDRSFASPPPSPAPRRRRRQREKVIVVHAQISPRKSALAHNYTDFHNFSLGRVPHLSRRHFEKQHYDVNQAYDMSEDHEFDANDAEALHMHLIDLERISQCAKKMGSKKNFNLHLPI